jgi:galactitol-specific phosphotransferase system IIB component
MRIRILIFCGKMGVGRSTLLRMRIENPHFWVKKRGVEVETSTNRHKLYEKI